MRIGFCVPVVIPCWSVRMIMNRHFAMRTLRNAAIALQTFMPIVSLSSRDK